jgi:hypothetical protein
MIWAHRYRTQRVDDLYIYTLTLIRHHVIFMTITVRYTYGKESTINCARIIGFELAEKAAEHHGMGCDSDTGIIIRIEERTVVRHTEIVT